MSDNGLPPRLRDIPSFAGYMSQGWGVPDRTPPVVAGAAEAAAAHRALLAAEFPGARLVVAAGQAPVRANDTYYDFRPDSDFAWLTGCTGVEDAVVVIDGGSAALYLPAPAYPGGTGFFSDPVHGELWVGAAPGLADWSAALGIEVRPLEKFKDDIDDLNGPSVAGAVTTSSVLSGPGLSGPAPDPRLGEVLSRLRLVKDEWEIGQLRRAVDHTVAGFAAVARELPAAIGGGGERWLQGTFDRHARTVGNGPGYSSIVGSGKHAPTLHWVRCDGPVRPSDLVLLDMGVEANSLYTADVTRTLPASGAFGDAQRRVHDLVEEAHRAGLAAVAPGRRFSDFHFACMEVLARGLADWGMLPVSVDEALSPAGQQHRRYLVCGVGHHLGLDVHDCSRVPREAREGRTALAPGMVLTVEPGLYFHAHDLTVPPELRGIGVRIEDDLLVTGSGAEILSAGLPIAASGLEEWLRTISIADSTASDSTGADSVAGHRNSEYTSAH
ncbi:MAG: aminopeptidase P family protein [Nocardiopsaceae bacterium]|nr:aminopeptidase P family protein [Nocardiopsaceae bacterium]